MKTLCRTALGKTVFGGEGHKLRQSKSARANYGRRLRSRSLVDCAKPQPCSFGRHPPLHLDCQECGQRGSGVAGGIARSDPRKSWDRTQRTASLHCVSWMTLLSAADGDSGANLHLCCFIWSEVAPLSKRRWTCRKVLKIARLFARTIFRKEVSLYMEARRN